MTTDSLDPAAEKWVEEILGYLNLSSGASDTHFLGGFNNLFGALSLSEGRRPDRKGGLTATPTWRAVQRELRSGLRRLAGTSKAFEQVDQAEAVVRLVFDHVLPGYREHHRGSPVPPDRGVAVSAVFHRPGVRGGVGRGQAVGRNRADRLRRGDAAERFHRPPARRPCSKAGRSSSPTITNGYGRSRFGFAGRGRPRGDTAN